MAYEKRDFMWQDIECYVDGTRETGYRPHVKCLFKMGLNNAPISKTYSNTIGAAKRDAFMTFSRYDYKYIKEIIWRAILC